MINHDLCKYQSNWLLHAIAITARDVRGSIDFQRSRDVGSLQFAPAALQPRLCPEGRLRADLLLGTSRSALHYAKDGQGVSGVSQIA